MDISYVTRRWRKLLKLKYCGAVIVAAGSASRMGGIDKVMTPLGGEPVIVRTVRNFQECDAIREIVIVTRAELIVPIMDLCHGFDKVKAAVKSTLKGKKIAAYYGCLLLRPSGVMAMDDPENPRIMEDFIRAIGADAVVYANRNECCGGYVTMESPEFAKKKSSSVVENAKRAGAEMIITACPLCLYNLKKSGCDIPVVYFTELLAEALGVKEGTNE